MGYLVGIGSNIAPERNVPCVLERLVLEFGEIRVGPVHRTEPEGIVSPRHFLNLVVYLESAWDEATLKQWLNALEEALGRDRSHPDKKRLDRTADLDILGHIAPGERLTPEELPREPYLRPSCEALAVALGLLERVDDPAPPGGVRLALNGIIVGEAPAGLRADPATGRWERFDLGNA